MIAATNKTSLKQQLVNWAEQRIGCIYVWGGQGEVNISEAWIRAMETSKENAERVIKLWKKRTAEGKKVAAYDCSGLITDFLLSNDLIQSDMTSRGLYAICEKINKNELTLGDLVFRHDGEKIYHIGIYAGNGMVIHARGRDYGVVKETLDQNGADYWNRFGRLGILEQKSESGGNELLKSVQYTGDSYVNLRREPDAESDNIIGRVSRDECAIKLNDCANGWCEVIVRKGNGFIRGYCLGSWFKEINGEEF